MDCWSRRLRIDRLAGRAGSLLPVEVQKSLCDVVVRSLQTRRIEELVVDTLAGARIEAVVAGTGRNFDRTGCMGLTCWL